MKNGIKYLLKFIVGITILSILLVKVGINDIINVFSTANITFIFIAFIPLLFSLLLASFNVHILILGLCKRIPLLNTFKYYPLSWSAGLFMPGKIGIGALAIGDLKLKTEKKALKNIKGTTGVFSFEEAYDISKELLAKKKDKKSKG